MSGDAGGARTAPLRSPDLYAALLARRSVRKFDQASLDEGTLARVREIAGAVRPLAPDVAFRVLFRDVAPGEDLVEALGAYGRIVSPPHYLVPYLDGPAAHLADLGYRVQQIVIRLTALGLGTCYVGCLPWEERSRAYFGLGEEARLGAAVIYGVPAKGRGGRALNAAMRRLVGATNKRPAEQSFYNASLCAGSKGSAWERPSAPPPELADLIEAARHAPSADNAQPWRFLWREGALYLYVVRSSWRYRLGGSQDYRFYDGGICMANVALAMEALGVEGTWTLLDEMDAGVPACPEALQPLAVLRLG